MSKTGLKSWLISPAVLGVMLWVGEGAIATPATQSQIPEPVTINTPAVVETSSVSELKDPPVTEEVDTQIPSLEIQEETPSSIFAQTPDDLSDTTLLEQINHYSNESEINSLDQITNISQLRDV
ncbi:MAG TPA: hypothetical protein DD379_10635, partial [Cyanobacteria bacterium UBA11162]|nr:hypothetical protein [Cyanobacteria bacterium UBA11162]